MGRFPFQLARFVALVLILSTGELAAAPFIPKNDGEVLERLPTRAGDPAVRELRRMREELTRVPHNLELALRLAKRYYSLALADGDPRYIGYAQAALAPWWDLAAPPVEVLVMRATLRQYNHDFASALKDLDSALAREPGSGAAWSLRAAVNMVQADYAEARRDCLNLKGLASDLITLACVATVDSLSGQAEQSYRALRNAFASRADATPAEKLWILTRLGEIADRLGKPDADAYFRQALALDISDAYLLAVYAEFLLDQNRPKEVVALLKGKERSDVLLVRLALAEKALRLPAAAEHEAAIRARFDAARLRGDKLHIQDEARFTLYFLNMPAEALKLAQENYVTQHEPSDARMLLEAALAARDPAAARPVLDWLARTRHEDPHIKRLAQKIVELRP